MRRRLFTENIVYLKKFPRLSISSWGSLRMSYVISDFYHAVYKKKGRLVHKRVWELWRYCFVENPWDYMLQDFFYDYYDNEINVTSLMCARTDIGNTRRIRLLNAYRKLVKFINRKTKGWFLKKVAECNENRACA